MKQNFSLAAAILLTALNASDVGAKTVEEKVRECVRTSVTAKAGTPGAVAIAEKNCRNAFGAQTKEEKIEECVRTSGASDAYKHGICKNAYVNE